MIESVLDTILSSLQARWIALVERSSRDEPGGLGRTAQRRPMKPPAWVRKAPIVEKAFLEAEAQHSSKPGSAALHDLALPILRDGQPSAVLFIEGSPIRPPDLLSPASDFERTVSTLVSLALVLDGMQRRNRQLYRSLQRHHIEVISLAGSRPPGAGAPATEPPPKPDDLARLFPEFIGKSAAIEDVLRAVVNLSRSDIPVLIGGESGTGKELVASAVHRLSRRRGKPFITENCGALPESLVEAELFGHERGAFTGAADTKPGLLERADGGTLFLDEIGEMDLQLQKRFLRVLQQREVRRLGASSPRAVDFRLISATNRDLDAMLAQGMFREDLFYRIRVASISLPALRERRDDIPLLVEHFATECASSPIEFHPETMEYLCAYSWPGNIRELRNEVWRLATSAHGKTVSPHELSSHIVRKLPLRGPDGFGAGSLWKLEKEIIGGAIRDALHKTGGNRAQAARHLGIGRATLYRRMERYGIHLAGRTAPRR